MTLALAAIMKYVPISTVVNFITVYKYLLPYSGGGAYFPFPY